MWGKLTVNSSNVFISNRIKFQNFNIPLFSLSFIGVSKQGRFYVLCYFRRREFLNLDLILSPLLISEYLYVTLQISAVGWGRERETYTMWAVPCRYKIWNFGDSLKSQTYFSPIRVKIIYYSEGIFHMVIMTTSIGAPQFYYMFRLFPVFRCT